MSKYEAQRAFESAQSASMNAQNKIYHLRQSGQATARDEAIEELARAVNQIATGLKQFVK